MKTVTFAWKLRAWGLLCSMALLAPSLGLAVDTPPGTEAPAGAEAAVSAGESPAEPVPEDKPLTQKLGLDASLRAAYWDSDRQYTTDKRASMGALWLRLQPPVEGAWSMKLEGWVSDQPALKHQQAGEWREAYGAYLGEDLDVRVGRQVVAWGRADRLNPTDNISPRDYRLLVPEDDDARLGLVMAHVGIPMWGGSLHLYWLPEFRPNRFAFPALPPGITLKEESLTRDDRQAAWRFDKTGGDVDWSVSYFEGRDRTPDIALESLSKTGVVLKSYYRTIRVAGADMATNLGPVGIRAEVAHTTTQDVEGTDPFIKNNFWYGVLGADESFAQYLNINVQYIYRYTEKWQDPSDIPNPLVQQLALFNARYSQQLHRVENGLMFRLAYQWLNETLTTEVASLRMFQTQEGLLQPKVTYKMTDTLRFTLGAIRYAGADDSLFGGQKPNNVTYLEARWGY